MKSRINVVFPSQEEMYRLRCRKKNYLLGPDGELTINQPYVQYATYADGSVSVTPVYSLHSKGREIYLAHPTQFELEHILEKARQEIAYVY